MLFGGSMSESGLAAAVWTTAEPAVSTKRMEEESSHKIFTS